MSSPCSFGTIPSVLVYPAGATSCGTPSRFAFATTPGLHLNTVHVAEFCTRFVLAILATWRVTHLLAREDGPADIIARFRGRLGDGFFGKLMDCFYCLSFWIAAPMAFYVSRAPLDWLFVWLALSGAACVLERLGREPVIIEPISQLTEGENTDVLRTKAGDAAGRFEPDSAAEQFYRDPVAGGRDLRP